MTSQALAVQHRLACPSRRKHKTALDYDMVGLGQRAGAGLSPPDPATQTTQPSSHPLCRQELSRPPL